MVPIWALNMRCHTIIGTQKGTIILTTTHLQAVFVSSLFQRVLPQDQKVKWYGCRFQVIADLTNTGPCLRTDVPKSFKPKLYALHAVVCSGEPPQKSPELPKTESRQGGDEQTAEEADRQRNRVQSIDSRSEEGARTYERIGRTPWNSNVNFQTPTSSVKAPKHTCRSCTVYKL